MYESVHLDVCVCIKSQVGVRKMHFTKDLCGSFDARTILYINKSYIDWKLFISRGNLFMLVHRSNGISLERIFRPLYNG